MDLIYGFYFEEHYHVSAVCACVLKSPHRIGRSTPPSETSLCTQLVMPLAMCGDLSFHLRMGNCGFGLTRARNSASGIAAGLGTFTRCACCTGT